MTSAMTPSAATAVQSTSFAVLLNITTCRPELDACLDHLRDGDVLTVWKLDRLGRNTQHVLAVVDQLTSCGIGFRSLTEGLQTEGPRAKPCSPSWPHSPNSNATP